MKRDMIPDFIAFIGIVLVSYGAWLVYPPAGFIVGGVLLLLAAFVMAAPMIAPEQEGS